MTVPKVSLELLAKLNELRYEIEDATAAAHSATAQLDQLVLSEFRKAKRRREKDLICLECGTIYDRNKPCPTCAG